MLGASMRSTLEFTVGTSSNVLFGGKKPLPQHGMPGLLEQENITRGQKKSPLPLSSLAPQFTATVISTVECSQSSKGLEAATELLKIMSL